MNIYSHYTFGINCVYAVYTNYLRKFGWDIREWELFIIDQGINNLFNENKRSRLWEQLECKGATVYKSDNIAEHLKAIEFSVFHEKPIILVLNKSILKFNYHHTDIGIHLVIANKCIKVKNALTIIDFLIFDQVGNVFMSIYDMKIEELEKAIVSTIYVDNLPQLDKLHLVYMSSEMFNEFLTNRKGQFGYLAYLNFFTNCISKGKYHKIIYFVKVNIISFLTYFTHMIYDTSFRFIFSVYDMEFLCKIIDKQKSDWNLLVNKIMFIAVNQSEKSNKYLVKNIKMAMKGFHYLIEQIHQRIICKNWR